MSDSRNEGGGETPPSAWVWSQYRAVSPDSPDSSARRAPVLTKRSVQTPPPRSASDPPPPRRSGGGGGGIAYLV
ncbi:MAG: hypothetical protein WA156_03630, partial [Methylocystis silviterrae]